MKNVIILNGASSSGKTTLSLHIQKVMPGPYVRMSVDDHLDLLPSDLRPKRAIDATKITRHDLISSYHESIAAVADKGDNVIVDHVIGEKKAWVEELSALLKGHNVIYIGVMCDLPVLLNREMSRTDREPDIEHAARQFRTIHDGMKYDFVIDTTAKLPEACALEIKGFIMVSTKRC